MKRPVNSLYLFGCVASVAAFIPTIAAAQDAPATAGQSVDPAAMTSDDTPASPAAGNQDNTGDIVVTAQRRAESLSRVGVSIIAVGEEQLRIQEIKAPADLTRVVPGFQATTAALTGSPVYILRGVGFDTPNPSTTAPVGVYVDEVAYAYPYMSLGVAFDLERVEVLKGPQGTLYGRNTTGGLVNFIAAKPTDTTQGSVTAGYGNYQTFDAEGFISGPISGTLRGRVAFQSQVRDEGWQVSVSRGERLGKSYRFSTRGSLDWTPTDHLTVDLTGTYWSKTGDTQAGQAIRYIRAPATLNPAAALSIIPNPTSNTQADFPTAGRQPQQAVTGISRPDQYVDSRFLAAALRVDLELSDALTLASLSSYNDLRYEGLSSASGLQSESQEAGFSGRIKSFAQELRLLGDRGNLSWSIGGYYAHDRTNDYNRGYVDELSTIVGLRTAAAGLNRARGLPVNPTVLGASFRNYAAQGESTNRVLAGFANAEYRFNPLIKLTLGGRYTNDRLRGTSCARDSNGNNVALINFLFPILTGNAALPPIAANGCYTLNANSTAFVLVNNFQKQSNFSYRGSVDITPSDTTLFYASISRGFKAGSFPVLAAANATQLRPVTQEEIKAYEGGVKLNLFDRHVQLNGSAYYYDYRDRQIFGREPDRIFGSLNRIVNVPRSEIYGAEADIAIRLGQYFNVRGSAAYLKTKVLEFTGFDTTSAAGIRTNFRGARLPYSPQWQLSGSLVGDVPLSDTLGGLAAVNVSYQTSSSAVLGDEAGYEIKGYALLGAKLGIHAADDQWRLEAYVNNLTNAYYWTSTQRGNEALVRYAGMPRTYGLRGTFSFR